MSKTYDAKCHDLAKHFLSDTPELDTADKAAGLAYTIQEAIEEWFDWESRAAQHPLSQG